MKTMELGKTGVKANSAPLLIVSGGDRIDWFKVFPLDLVDSCI